MTGKIFIGNAPCSWGTLEFSDIQGDRLTHTQMLDELAATGYTGSELGDWGFMPTDPAALCAEFAARRLDLTGAFVGVRLADADAHPAGEATAVHTARLLAAVADGRGQTVRPFLVLADDNGAHPVRTAQAGRITPELGLSDHAWRTFAAGVERIAAAVAGQTGLRTVFHHHCAGYIETPEEIARLLELTDAELVGLVFDTGHYSYGAGGSASIGEALDRFGPRIDYVHFKDCDPAVLAQSRTHGWDYFEAVRHGVFSELGRGSVDFAGVRDWLVARGYSGYITVEQDVLPGMGAPKVSAQRNREYLRSIGL